MRLTGRGEPHTDVIDSGLHEGAGAMFGIDGQLCADDFDEVGAGECGLLDALRGGHQPFPIQRCQRGFCAGLGAWRHAAPSIAKPRSSPRHCGANTAHGSCSGLAGRVALGGGELF